LQKRPIILRRLLIVATPYVIECRFVAKKRGRENAKEHDGQVDRQTDRQIDRQIDGQTDKQIERDRERGTHTHRRPSRFL